MLSAKQLYERSLEHGRRTGDRSYIVGLLGTYRYAYNPDRDAWVDRKDGHPIPLKRIDWLERKLYQLTVDLLDDKPGEKNEISQGQK